jgi:hypothetical protein
MHTYGYVCGDLCIDIGIYIAVSYLHHLSISMNLSPIYISIISIHLYVSVSSLFIYHLSPIHLFVSIYLCRQLYKSDSDSAWKENKGEQEAGTWLGIEAAMLVRFNQCYT